MKRIDINKEYLNTRENNIIKAGYNSPKWINYCRSILDRGLRIKMCESKSTVSKYIYSSNGKKVFKVRFSNHKPNRKKQFEKDCDFFVGVSNGLVTKTEDAIKATVEFFNT